MLMVIKKRTEWVLCVWGKYMFEDRDENENRKKTIWKEESMEFDDAETLSDYIIPIVDGIMNFLLRSSIVTVDIESLME